MDDTHVKPETLNRLDDAKVAVRKANDDLREIYAAYGYLYLQVIEGDLDDSILRNLIEVTRNT